MNIGGLAGFACFIKQLLRLPRATEGAVAMEFGLITPMLVAMLVPLIDISTPVQCQMK